MAPRKSNAGSDIFKIVATFPWWIGVILAAASYAVLHHYSVASVSAATHTRDLAGSMAGVMVKGISTFGQYALPFICIAGAVISAWRRRNRRGLFESVSASHDANALNTISWREFEMLTGEAFRRQGYAVVETGGNGPDGGIDLVLRKDGEKFYVQCKQWKAQKVGVQTVRELFGVMAAGGATGGFVVTSGSFTQDAINFAEGRRLSLIGRAELAQMIGQVRQALNVSEATQTPRRAVSSVEAGNNPLACPLCSSKMTDRIARKGPNAGERFLGCTTYPACRGTRVMASARAT